MPKDDDVTREVTGRDAPIETADRGEAGNGASPFGADTTGLEHVHDPDARGFMVAQVDEEDTEDAPQDISPDKLEKGFSDGLDDDDRDLSARPREEIRPITPDLLPSDDPGAATGDEDAEERAENARWAEDEGAGASSPS